MNAKAVDLFERINYAPLQSPGLGSYPDVPVTIISSIPTVFIPMLSRMTHHNIHIQPRAHMPRAMTVQRPHARIIRIKLYDCVPRGRVVRRRLHDMSISSRRIRQIGHFGSVIEAVTLIDDEEVVAMEMHGVRGVFGGDVVVEDDADGGDLAEVIDVPVGVVGVGYVSAVGFAEDRMTGLRCEIGRITF